MFGLNRFYFNFLWEQENKSKQHRQNHLRCLCLWEINCSLNNISIFLHIWNLIILGPILGEFVENMVAASQKKIKTKVFMYSGVSFDTSHNNAKKNYCFFLHWCIKNVCYFLLFVVGMKQRKSILIEPILTLMMFIITSALTPISSSSTFVMLHTI